MALLNRCSPITFLPMLLRRIVQKPHTRCQSCIHHHGLSFPNYTHMLSYAYGDAVSPHVRAFCKFHNNLVIKKHFSTTDLSYDTVTDKVYNGHAAVINEHFNSDNEEVLNLIVGKLRSKFPEKREGVLEQYVLPLLSLNCKPKDIVQLLTSRTDLLKVSPDKWNQGLCLLTESGFYKDQLLAVVQSVPEVFSTKESKIVISSVEGLRNLGFREKAIQKLLANNPTLFHVSKHDLRVRLDELSTLFRSIDVIRLALNSPVVLTDKWHEVKAKFDYVLEQMGKEPKEMMKSCLFQHDFRHIRNRHLFLFRAGLYEKPDKHGSTSIVNHHLRDIVDSADNVFAITHARMDTEDYHTFTRMMQNEDNEDHTIHFKE